MKAPVLLYHKIDLPTPDVKVRGAYTAPRFFEKQLAYLVRNKIKVVTVGELIEHFNQTGSYPERTRDLVRRWLERQLSERISITEEIWNDSDDLCCCRLSGPNDRSSRCSGEAAREHMTVDDVHEMAACGIEFGSHTMSHSLLNNTSPDETEKEIVESKSFVEELTQTQCKTIAYPAGFFTEHAKNSARNAGYIAAFSTIYGDDDGDDLFELNRTEILRRDKYMFRFSRKIRSVIVPTL